MKRVTTFLVLSILALCLFSLAAHAQDAGTIDTGSYILSIIELVKNIKSGAVAGIAIASAVISALLQLLKVKAVQPLLGKVRPAVLHLINVVLTQVLAIIVAKISGLSYLDAAIAGLITSGGAILIYAAVVSLKVKETAALK